MPTLRLTFVGADATGTERHTDVAYEVSVDGKVLAADVIQRFDRRRGWQGLVAELLTRRPERPPHQQSAGDGRGA